MDAITLAAAKSSAKTITDAEIAAAKGAADGIAPLNNSTKIPYENLNPSHYSIQTTETTPGSAATYVLRVFTGSSSSSFSGVKIEIPKADGIPYDDSDTQLGETNVQGAISAIATLMLPKITVTAPSGSAITIEKDSTTITGTATSGTFSTSLPDVGEWFVTATLSGETATGSVNVESFGQSYSISLSYVKIYGVSWDKTSTTHFSRTDDASLFIDPTPAISNGSGSSPFDNLYPWSGMVVETIGGNSLVKIPKFWYKWTNENGALKLQIADGAVDGFSVSPAHANRGDGAGERDYVYVGRYKCGSDYKSASGKSPKVNITRSSARSGIASLGAGYFLQDYAMFWTLRMLFLVEFADWNSQAVIGYGCGNNSSAESTGTTDSAQYHTGTSRSSRNTYGAGIQYRHIEDPWGNVLEWIDGIRFSGTDVYVQTNPSSYSDSSGGTKVATRPTSYGYISAWTVPSTSELDWALYPSAVSGSENTYVADCCYYGGSDVVLGAGGSYSQNQYCGLFYLYDTTVSYSHGSVGARLQYLP